MRSCCRRGNHLESNSRTVLTHTTLLPVERATVSLNPGPGALEISQLPNNSLKVSRRSMANFSPEPRGLLDEAASEGRNPKR